MIVADDAIGRGGVVPPSTASRAPGGGTTFAGAAIWGPVGIDVDQMKFAGFRDKRGPCRSLQHIMRTYGGRPGPRSCHQRPLMLPFARLGIFIRRIVPAHSSSSSIPRFADSVLILPLSSTGMCIFATARCRRIRCRFLTGVGRNDLLPSAPFEFRVSIPWYLIGANAFDGQRFRTAHDRTLVGDLVVDSPAPLARQIAEPTA